MKEPLHFLGNNVRVVLMFLDYLLAFRYGSIVVYML